MQNSQSKTPLLPAYLIVGDDAMKRERARTRLRARVEKEGDLTFNAEDFDGANATGGAIVSACNTIPFASPLRLVTVANAEKLRKADAEALVEYLSSPCETTVLALVAEKLAKNTRLYKAVARVGKTSVVDCAAKKGYKLNDEVRKYAQARGLRFTDDAVRALLARTGESTVALDAEIAKLALACPHDRPVTGADIEALVAQSADVKPWDFTAAFASRDLAGCLRLWDAMQAPNPHYLLNICVERIRELICAQCLIAQGEQRRIAEALGQPDWRVKNHAAWARRFAPGELEAALLAAAETERAMKSGADADDAFLAWVIQTAKPPKRR